MKYILTITVACIISGCSLFTSTEEMGVDESFCQQYQWDEVRLLVSPHLDELLVTAFTTLGQSNDFNTAQAAQSVIDEISDHNVKQILHRIIAAKCP